MAATRHCRDHASHHAPRTAGVALLNPVLSGRPIHGSVGSQRREGTARTPVVHAGFCLSTPYLSGPRSTYMVAVPIAARRKTDYVGCEGFMYVVAVHRVGNSHRLCGRVGQCEAGGLG